MPLHLSERLAKNLARARARKGWTQDEAAERVGIAYRSYRRLEKGEARFSQTSLEQLCKAFGVDVLDLFVR